MNGGEIILADEPTGALDSHSGREVMALLKELSAEGYTVILITHDSHVAEHAHRQIEIADGQIVSDPGPAGSLPGASLQRQPLAHRPSLARELYQGAHTAVRSMVGNLFRTALTLLGIVIGVASVITMLAIGDGARESVVERISAMGSNLLLVRPGAPGQRRGGWNIATLVPEDVQAINTLPNIIAAIPELTGSQTLRYGNADHQAEVNATSWQFPQARQWPVVQGSFFSEADEAEYAPVAVLGKTASEALFGEADPVGRYILMNNVLFQVIGVMSERGASPMGQDQDDVVLVPYTTGSMRIFGQRHGVEDFQIRNMASLIDTVSETQDTFTWLLGSVAAISLLVGGIGVMNIMLVSVTERTREIGIRMATGARARHILQQFLLEALAVSALGGLIGVGLGLGAAALVAHLGTPVSYSLLPVLLAFGCAFGTGLLFGFLPARKAARLDPVAALATE